MLLDILTLLQMYIWSWNQQCRTLWWDVQDTRFSWKGLDQVVCFRNLDVWLTMFRLWPLHPHTATLVGTSYRCHRPTASFRSSKGKTCPTVLFFERRFLVKGVSLDPSLFSLEDSEVPWTSTPRVLCKTHASCPLTFVWVACGCKAPIGK